MDEKVERDRLNGIYLELVEQQRSYYKSVRDFQEVISLFVNSSSPPEWTVPTLVFLHAKVTTHSSS